MVERIVCGNVNCYIVGKRGSCSLVDTATEKYFDRICRRASELGVKLIVLTHCHYDHVAGAARLADALKVPIAVNSADIPFLFNYEYVRMEADTFTGRAMLWMSRRNMKRRIPAFSPSVELCDKLDLTAFGAEGEAYALPGHTPGSMGVYYDGALIAGDAVSNIFTACRAKSYYDKEAADASYRRITEDERITTIYPGHGRPIYVKRDRPAMIPVNKSDEKAYL